jgi:hypothetical protein
MHRSGTSVLTRVVNLLGADLAAHLIPPSTGNVSGHWESRAVQGIHNDILSELGSDVYSPVNFPQSWFDGPSAKLWIERIQALIDHEYCGSNIFVIKDPRITLFIPLWATALHAQDIEAHFIIPFRNPCTVAASLELREQHLNSGNSLTPALAILIWLRYSLAAERFTRARSRSFVSFDMLLADWRRELTRISSQLNVRLPRSGISDEEVDRFVDSKHADPVTVSPVIEEGHICQSVYDSFNQLVVDPHTMPFIFQLAAEKVAVAEKMLGAYVLHKEAQIVGLRKNLNETLVQHAADMASVYRTFEVKIRARDDRTAAAGAYAESLERSRAEAFCRLETQEVRINELKQQLKAARRSK